MLNDDSSNEQVLNLVLKIEEEVALTKLYEKKLLSLVLNIEKEEALRQKKEEDTIINIR